MATTTDTAARDAGAEPTSVKTHRAPRRPPPSGTPRKKRAPNPNPKLALSKQLPQIDNGEVRMPFAQPAARGYKQRKRRSR